MKNYYYLNAKREQCGPLPAKELLKNGVTAETLVWCEGMSNWTKAGEVLELKNMFNSTATPPPVPSATVVPPVPPVPPVSVQPSSDKCPDSYLIFSILSTLFCCLPTGIAAIVYASKVEKLWYSGDKAGAQKYSEQAKIWCVVSVGCGLIFNIFMFFVGFIGGLM